MSLPSIHGSAPLVALHTRNWRCHRRNHLSRRHGCCYGSTLWRAALRCRLQLFTRRVSARYSRHGMAVCIIMCSCMFFRTMSMRLHRLNQGAANCAFPSCALQTSDKLDIVRSQRLASALAAFTCNHHSQAVKSAGHAWICVRDRHHRCKWSASWC